MILLIDNYDSFVHNLARYFERLGQPTRVIRNDAATPAWILDQAPEAIVLSPGPCTPDEAGHCLDIVRKLHLQIPILGICLGHQAIAQALGGRVVRAAVPMHGRTSSMLHDGRGVFADVPSPMHVCRYHSLIVERESLPDCLQVSGCTPDGVIMSVRHTISPVVGLQFHPESILTEHGYYLLANFLQLAALPWSNPPDFGTEMCAAQKTPHTAARYTGDLLSGRDGFMILEGLLTTLNEDGSPQLAPMGPTVDRSMKNVLLHPFPDSRSCANLKRTREGVFHVTDDVEMIARSAVHRLDHMPRMQECTAVNGKVVLDACRWYGLRVAKLDEQGLRTHIECDVVGHGRLRDFFGFNRAKHAVLEAAVLATRTKILPARQIRDDYERLRVIVEKTAGDQERRAFEFLESYIQDELGDTG